MYDFAQFKLLLTECQTKEIQHFELNPLFHNYGRGIFKELCNVSHADLLLFDDNVRNPSPAIVLSFEQLLSKSFALQTKEIKTAIRIFQKSMFSLSKKMMNQRVVIIGNSSASAGLLSKLLTSKDTFFTNISIVVPQTISAIDCKENLLTTSTTDANTALHQLSVSSRVEFVHDDITSLDCDSKNLSFASGISCKYDKLIICAEPEPMYILPNDRYNVSS